MKKTRKVFVSMATLGLLFSNVAIATTEVVEKSDEGLPTKYIFMGIAGLVIVLLLFLGYKMDTKDGNGATKISHKAEKTMKKLSAKAEAMQHNSGVYEEDDEAYEDDGELFDNDDLNGSVEYSDDEDSLYSVSNEEDDEEINNNPVGIDFEDKGEEFDTSIIDGLDEESSSSKKSFEETMLFNNTDFSATGSTLEDEIDGLDNINDIELEEDNTEIEDGEKEEDTSFIDELKSYEEPESSFEGFSVATNNSKKDDKTKNEEVESKIEEENENIFIDKIDSDFLSQMEANLQKNKATRNETKTTFKRTLNKKEDKF